MELQVKQLVMAIKQLAEEKNLPEDVVHEAVEQALQSQVLMSLKTTQSKTMRSN